MQKYSKTKAKFAKIEALHKLGADGRKEARRMHDSWNRRTSNNVEGFYNPKAAKAASKGL